MTTAFSKGGVPRTAESRTPLGRFEGDAWVPAAIHVDPLVPRPKAGHASARRQRSS
jgi:hypothetical protein